MKLNKACACARFLNAILSPEKWTLRELESAYSPIRLHDLNYSSLSSHSNVNMSVSQADLFSN